MYESCDSTSNSPKAVASTENCTWFIGRFANGQWELRSSKEQHELFPTLAETLQKLLNEIGHMDRVFIDWDALYHLAAACVSKNPRDAIDTMNAIAHFRGFDKES